MAYNLSWMDNITSPVDVYDGVNAASDGLLGIFILVILWVVLFVMLRNEDFPKRFLVTNSVITIIAALLWFGQFITWQAVIVPIVLLVSSLFVHFFVQ